MEEVKEWNHRIGNPNPERITEEMNLLQDMPQVSPKTVRFLICPPWLMEKTQRAPIELVGHNNTKPLEIIHLEVQGPMEKPSIGGRRYTIVIMEDFKAKSAFVFLTIRSQVYESERKYMATSERTKNCRLKDMRLDSAGQHMGEIKSIIESIEGVQLGPYT